MRFNEAEKKSLKEKNRIEKLMRQDEKIFQHFFFFFFILTFHCLHFHASPLLACLSYYFFFSMHRYSSISIYVIDFTMMYAQLCIFNKSNQCMGNENFIYWGLKRCDGVRFECYIMSWMLRLGDITIDVLRVLILFWNSALINHGLVSKPRPMIKTHPIRHPHKNKINLQPFLPSKIK